MKQLITILAPILFAPFFACKTQAPMSDSKAIERLNHPPAILYHYGQYKDLQVYTNSFGPPSETVWQSIPSTGPNYTSKRRGLYGAQHPGYNERYAKDNLGKRLEENAWMMVIRLADRCHGPDWDQSGVVIDSEWEGSGFWIIRDRTCIINIQTRPEAILEVFAQTPELWHEQPFVDHSRATHNRSYKNMVLLTILLRSVADSAYFRPGIWDQVSATARSSDNDTIRTTMEKTIAKVRQCIQSGSQSQLQTNIRRQLTTNVNITPWAADGEFCSNQNGIPAEADNNANKPVTAANMERPRLEPGLYKLRTSQWYHRLTRQPGTDTREVFLLQWGDNRSTVFGGRGLKFICETFCWSTESSSTEYTITSKKSYHSRDDKTKVFEWISP